MNSQALAAGNGATPTSGPGPYETRAVPERRRRRTSGGLPIKILKLFLLLVAWVDLVWWVSLWYRNPSAEGSAFRKKLQKQIGTNTFWGKYATNYVLYVVPVIGLALVALVYLELQERFPDGPKSPASGRQPYLVNLWRSVWTQPLLVKTPVGVITLFDIAVFVIVAVCSLWIWLDLQRQGFYKIDHSKVKKGDPSRTIQKWAKSSSVLGNAIPFTVACLFVPVARGSPLLRMADIPFEQAIKYHRWIGYLLAVLIFIHGGEYAVALGLEHKTRLLRQWPLNGDSNLPGVISGVIVFIMTLTAIPFIRKRHFNFFYSVHHLYFPFFIFYVLHVDWNHAGQSMGPILLFFIDRFLRMVQSWKQVTGVTARVLPSGLVQLKIPKQPGFKYNALSFIYINIPGISKLQWHPFSTTSSILDDSNEMTVCIKSLGDWTHKVHDNVEAQYVKQSGCPFAVKTVHAEGPYGHESNYFLRYKNLVLVAGGAGITPFLAIIQDLLRRHHFLQDGLPTNVHLIWCVRRREELATLKTIKPADIFPGYAYSGTAKSGSLNLTIEAYVTGDAIAGEILPLEPPAVVFAATTPTSVPFPDSPQKEGFKNHNGMSTVNSFQNLWMIALIVVSMTGFVLMHALLYNYVSSPKFLKKGEKFSTTEEGVLHFVSLFVGIVICGGSVIFFWIASTRAGNGNQEVKVAEMRDLEGDGGSDLLDTCDVTEGARPQFQGVFDKVSGRHKGEEVGVLVCGPSSLQASVASACRSRNFESFLKTPFHYHSVSFDL